MNLTKLNDDFYICENGDRKILLNDEEIRDNCCRSIMALLETSDDCYQGEDCPFDKKFYYSLMTPNDKKTVK